jgi:hypothetical protein
MMTSTRNLRSLRSGLRKPAARRACLEVTHLEDRLVPSTITGMTFLEQRDVSTLVPVFSSPTLFQDQINQTWQNILSGRQLIGGKTLQQEVNDSIQQAANQQAVNAYDIKESFASRGDYSAWLDTSSGRPTLDVRYHLGGNSMDFTTTTNSPLGGWADPSFHVSFDMTLNVSVTLPTSLSPGSTISASASGVIDHVHVSSDNTFVWLANIFGTNVPQEIADHVNGHTQDLSGLVPTGALNLLLRGEAARGYTHLQAGLDGNGNLQLTGQKADLVVYGNNNDHIVVRETADSGVQITAAGQTETFDAGYLRSITINANAGTNSIRVLSVPAGVSVSVKDVLGGIDSVTVGNGSLASVGGPVRVSNTSGKTSLTIDDSADQTGRMATLHSGEVWFLGLQKVSYSGKVTALKVLSGQGTNTYFVESTAAGTPVSILSGIGHDTVIIDGSLADIAAGVYVQGSNASRSTLIVDDSLDSGRSATVTSSSVTFTGRPAITYTGLKELDVVGAGGHNTITVASVPSGVPVSVYNTAHNVVTGAAASKVTQYSGLPLWDLFRKSRGIAPGLAK